MRGSALPRCSGGHYRKLWRESATESAVASHRYLLRAVHVYLLLLTLGGDESQAADLHIVLGSSLRVSPACDLPRMTSEKPGGRLVICNLQKTPLDGRAALVIHARVDEMLQLLMQELGTWLFVCDFADRSSCRPDTATVYPASARYSGIPTCPTSIIILLLAVWMGWYSLCIHQIRGDRATTWRDDQACGACGRRCLRLRTTTQLKFQFRATTVNQIWRWTFR